MPFVIVVENMNCLISLYKTRGRHISQCNKHLPYHLNNNFLVKSREQYRIYLDNQ